MLKRIKRRLDMKRLAFLERRYRAIQPDYLSRVHTVGEIPDPETRWANGYGTITYSEWCFTLGLFQGLFHRLRPEGDMKMLDIGCGIGRLYLAMKPMPAMQARSAQHSRLTIPALTSPACCRSGRIFSEDDFFFYLKELGRVLEPGGKAMITFFIMDEHYDASVDGRTAATSAYYPQPEEMWKYDVPAYESDEFFTIKAAKVPEDAIGVRKSAFDRAVAEAGLSIAEYIPGYWKERPGYWFQDIVVFEKAG